MKPDLSNSTYQTQPTKPNLQKNIHYNFIKSKPKLILSLPQRPSLVYNNPVQFNATLLELIVTK